MITSPEMLSHNNTPLPSVPSKHGLSVHYYISSRLESGGKGKKNTHQMRPRLTCRIKETDKGGRLNTVMEFFKNGGMIEGYVLLVCGNELLMQHLGRLFQI